MDGPASGATGTGSPTRSCTRIPYIWRSDGGARPDARRIAPCSTRRWIGPRSTRFAAPRTRARSSASATTRLCSAPVEQHQSRDAAHSGSCDSDPELGSGELHLAKERLEPGLVAEGLQEERTFDRVRGAAALGYGAIEEVEGAVVLAEARVDVHELIGRDVLRPRQLLDLAQHIARLLHVAGEAVDRAELREPERVAGRHRGGALEIG